MNVFCTYDMIITITMTITFRAATLDHIWHYGWYASPEILMTSSSLGPQSSILKHTTQYRIPMLKTCSRRVQMWSLLLLTASPFTTIPTVHTLLNHYAKMQTRSTFIRETNANHRERWIWLHGAILCMNISSFLMNTKHLKEFLGVWDDTLGHITNINTPYFTQYDEDSASKSPPLPILKLGIVGQRRTK